MKQRFTVKEVFNQKQRGGNWAEKERYSTFSAQVLTHYQWENTKAVRAGGVETVIALSAEFRFIPLYRVGTSEFWSSTPGGKHYGRYDQARDWLCKTLEPYEK